MIIFIIIIIDIIINITSSDRGIGRRFITHLRLLRTLFGVDSVARGDVMIAGNIQCLTQSIGNTAGFFSGGNLVHVIAELLHQHIEKGGGRNVFHLILSWSRIACRKNHRLLFARRHSRKKEWILSAEMLQVSTREWRKPSSISVSKPRTGTETVKVKSCFFTPLIAFFRILFNRLPVITRSKFWFYFFFWFFFGYLNFFFFFFFTRKWNFF